MKTRRGFLYAGSAGLAAMLVSPRYAFPGMQGGAEYDVTKYGAAGDGSTVDTAAVQKAIDTAASRGGGRVILPAGKRFLCGGLILRSGIEFHLGSDAVLLANTDPADYGTLKAMLNCDGAQGLKITGPGALDGQALKFMTAYDETDERWEPKAFRPRMFSLVRAKDMEITSVSFGGAPNWGLHMLGCERVLVDGLRVRNYMNVPNCDGIDPDHCRDVEIRNCDIVGADDSIVIKTSEQKEDYGPSRNITVKDCVVSSRDSGLKVGTETFGDISKILFERCKVLSAGRGPTITHRQPGNIEDIEFRDIEIVAAEHHAARWWGWGEAISITAWPRTADGKVGSLRNIRLRNIHGRAENSVRIDGQKDQPIEDVLLEKIDITIDKWTKYPGGKFDNRPTGPNVEGLELHDTPVFSIRNANRVLVKDCTARWGQHPEKYFSNALQASNVQGLKLERFNGKAAFPDARKAVVIT
ncbi:Glycosyl hydrolases family 28 [Granulicella rosea]|uniref:Glycosyl hydrolases family 28 n=1 Tax=Granulicella rosea TaxID=474952 RepID=A0A239MN93_9BACT|nr:glycosyl hydrolase family 28 protein [Granulicella rosea]SNT44125.1 Glycosyl hydrolases family 28 [Granulicella rosea]